MDKLSIKITNLGVSEMDILTEYLNNNGYIRVKDTLSMMGVLITGVDTIEVYGDKYLLKSENVGWVYPTLNNKFDYIFDYSSDNKDMDIFSYLVYNFRPGYVAMGDVFKGQNMGDTVYVYSVPIDNSFIKGDYCNPNKYPHINPFKYIITIKKFYDMIKSDMIWGNYGTIDNIEDLDILFAKFLEYKEAKESARVDGSNISSGISNDTVDRSSSENEENEPVSMEDIGIYMYSEINPCKEIFEQMEIGTELYSSVLGKVYFEGIADDGTVVVVLKGKTDDGYIINTEYYFTTEGVFRMNDHEPKDDASCTLWPIHRGTWGGWTIDKPDTLKLQVGDIVIGYRADATLIGKYGGYGVIVGEIEYGCDSIEKYDPMLDLFGN